MSTDQITPWERDAGHSRTQARRSNVEPLGDYATMGFQASTGAVTSTSPGILTVNGAGTTTYNAHVKVNGTVGALIQ